MVQVLRETAPAKGQSCRTCPNAGWVKAIRDALDSMLAYNPSTEEGAQELPLSTSIPQILRVLKYRAKDLDIEPYTLQIQALRGHIYKCEKERWDALEERRAEIAAGA